MEAFGNGPKDPGASSDSSDDDSVNSEIRTKKKEALTIEIVKAKHSLAEKSKKIKKDKKHKK